MTKGEFRVGISFNPSADDTVSKIKRAAADLIDLIDNIAVYPHIDGDDAHNRTQSERFRLKVLAQSEIEIAAMLAVKAETKT